VTTKIYLLRDPIDGSVRYVGKTVQTLARRLGIHVSRRSTYKSHANSWIIGLLAIGKRPLIELIELCGDDWEERERFWIAHYRMIGASLTNHTDGGEGKPGNMPSEETRAKMRAAHARRTPEMKATHLAAMAAFRGENNCAHRPEVKEKRSRNNGMKRPEVRAKFLASIDCDEYRAAHATPEVREIHRQAALKRNARPEYHAKMLANLAKARATRWGRQLQPQPPK
jgi:hypothetical protein